MSRHLRTLAEWRQQRADTRLLRHHPESHDDGQLVSWQIWPPSATERGGMAWLATMNYGDQPREVGVDALHAQGGAVVREWPAISPPAPVFTKKEGAAARLRGNDVGNGTEPESVAATVMVDPHSLTIWQFNHTVPFLDDGLFRTSTAEDAESSSSSDPLLPLWIVLGCVGGIVVIVLLAKYCKRKQGSKSVNGDDDETARLITRRSSKRRE